MTAELQNCVTAELSCFSNSAIPHFRSSHRNLGLPAFPCYRVLKISPILGSPMAFSFLQRGNLADHARQLTLASYEPELALEGLITGVDNVRVDVYLSSKF